MANDITFVIYFANNNYNILTNFCSIYLNIQRYITCEYIQYKNDKYVHNNQNRDDLKFGNQNSFIVTCDLSACNACPGIEPQSLSCIPSGFYSLQNRVELSHSLNFPAYTQEYNISDHAVIYTYYSLHISGHTFQVTFILNWNLPC